MGSQLIQRFGQFFFFLMLVIPTTFQLVRGVMLSVLVMGCCYVAMLGKWKIHKTVLYIGILCVTTSLIFINYGQLNDAPGAASVATVFVVWPLLFLFFMGGMNSPCNFQPYIKVIILGVSVASLMGVLLVFSGLDLLGINLESIFEFQGARVGIYDGTFEYQLYNLTTVIFGFGFLLALLTLPDSVRSLNGFWKFNLRLAFVLACLAMLFSGRRALWVVAACSPLIIYLLSRISGLANPFRLKFVLVMFLAIAVGAGLGATIFNINFEMMFTDLLSGFDFNDASNESASVRGDQFRALFSGWQEAPLWGFGHGSFSPLSIRDNNEPWAYELSYMSLLFQVGLIGFLIYTAALVWMYVKSIMIMRNQPEAASLLLPLLVGLTGFLIANATNPYLAKFDYLWVIFLPVAVVNSYLLQRVGK